MSTNNELVNQKRNEKRKNLLKEIDKDSFAHFIIKICKRCNNEKKCFYSDFTFKTKKPIYRNVCNDCYNEQTIKNKKGNKNFLNKRKEKIKNQKIKCVEYKGGKCERCGYKKSLRALTFHHKIREDKEKQISSMLDYSWEKLTFELDKCSLLCFNCHMEIEEEYENERANNNKE